MGLPTLPPVLSNLHTCWYQYTQEQSRCHRANNCLCSVLCRRLCRRSPMCSPHNVHVWHTGQRCRVRLHIIHINFNFTFHWQSKVAVHIIRKCVLQSRFYGTTYSCLLSMSADNITINCNSIIYKIYKP